MKSAFRLLLTTTSAVIFAGSEAYSQGNTVQNSSDSLRLPNVIKEVILNNDRVAAARYSEQAALAKIGPAGSWDDPMLMAGVVNLPTSFDFKEDGMTMKMIGLSQNIPYAGQKGLQAGAARAESKAAYENRRYVEIEAATNAKFAFLNLYYQNQILKDIINQRDLLKDIAESVLAKFRTDGASQADISAAQADLWRMESDILSAQQEVETAQNNLSALMGREPGSSLPPPAKPSIQALPEAVQIWLDSAKRNYPPLQRLSWLADSYDLAARSAGRMRWPMLNLAANYGFRSDSPMEERMDMVGFQATLSLPFFSGRQQGAMASSMKAMKYNVNAEAAQLRLEVESDLRTSYSKIRRLSRSLQIYRERIIPAGRDAYRSTLAGYSSDRASFADLQRYAMTIYKDQISANQIEYELLYSIAEAERYISAPEDFKSQ